MSAYVVDDVTINRILTGINTAWSDDQRDYPKPKGHLAEESNPDIAYLGKRLFDLNCLGVDERYGAGEAENFRSLNYQYQPVTVSRVQLLKSLRCFLYQCSEGDVPETSDLYKDLDTFSMELAYYIVCDLPEYERAEWE